MQRKSGIVDLCSLLMIEMLTKGAAPWGTRFFDNRFPFFFVVVNETRSKPCNRWGNDWIHPRGFTLISAVSERVPRRRTGECRSSISLSLSLRLQIVLSCRHCYCVEVVTFSGRGPRRDPATGLPTGVDGALPRKIRPESVRIIGPDVGRSGVVGRNSNVKETERKRRWRPSKKKRRNADKSMANGWAQRGGATPGRPRFFRAFVGSSQRTTSFWGLVAFGGTAFFLFG